MFDDTLIVQSAVSTFNNMALRAPDFFWSAVLALPIFIAAWFFAKPISEKFKLSCANACVIAVASIMIWFLARTNYMVLRDSFLGTGTVAAVILFLGFAFLARKYYETDIRLSKFMNKFRVRTRRIADGALPVLIAAIAGAAALPDWRASLVQFAAAGFGILVGYLRQRRDNKALDPMLVTGVIILAVVFGMTAQPEFYRFGQMGHLTGVHLLFLTAAAALFAFYFALRFISPRGFLKARVFKRVRLIGLALALLIFVLFALTESELAFAALFVFMLAYFALTVRHIDAKDSGNIKNVRDQVWYSVLSLFGVLTAMPLLTAIAIILYKTDARKISKEFVKSLL